MIEIINTSASIVEIGKNVKLGDGEPIMLREGKMNSNEVRANQMNKDVDDKYESERQKYVYHLNKRDDESSEPPELNKVIMRKLEPLIKAEKQVLGPMMREYYDLFLYNRSGSLPCTEKGFHEIKTGDALPIKKNHYKAPFALREEMKRQLDEMLHRGIITPSLSEWAAPVILVRKKSVDGTPKYRFSRTKCGDKNTSLPYSRCKR
jgi:hypothetical protein